MNQFTADQWQDDTRVLILPLDQIRATDLPWVGGKAANLGELTAAGFPVPPGFCITISAFDCFMRAYAEQETLLRRLNTLTSDDLANHDLEGVRRIGAEVRSKLGQTPIPTAVAQAVLEAWHGLGDDHAYAVRSSATAEDQPDASFAGQQDTYLNVRGAAALLESVRNCWASLFTDRAILYRRQRQVDPRNVRIAVVVQRMVEPQVSGILFTADPVTNQRNLLSIDASFGLGEALVSGLVSADLYQVDKPAMRIVKRQIADKQLQVRVLPSGGVTREDLPAHQRQQPALSDKQVLDLATLGTKIEAHYGAPQDIEWAIRDGQLFILQARPITTLYPIPQPAPTDDALHVYFSFGHFQMMTDPMPELALSLWRTLFPAGRPVGGIENPYVTTAGGWLYIDLSGLLHHRLFGRILPNAFANIDALAAQILSTIVLRQEFQRHGQAIATLAVLRWQLPIFGRALQLVFGRNPEGASAWGMARMDRYLAAAEAKLAAAPADSDPSARLKVAIDLLLDIFPTILREWFCYPIGGQLAHGLLQRVMSRVAASDKLVAADLAAVGRGLPGNVVNEMNLAVTDLADVIRQSPALLDQLSDTAVPVHKRLAAAATLPGGREFLIAWQEFLARYGMRAPAEIDLSRPRWHEDPTSLLQMVLSNALHGKAGAQRTQTQQWITEGEAAATRLVEVAAQGLGGWLRRPLVRRLTRATRHLLPTREHHKFWIVRLLSMLKPVFLAVAKQLVAEGQFERVEDIWFLTVPELLDLVKRTRGLRPGLIAERRAALTRFKTLTPPRVITSTGEIPIANLAHNDAPAGTLLGSPVSAGVVEGSARVVRDPQTATVKQGEILIAPFTDPAWTPLFINAAGVVTEVGGYMTHGSVVAREYGIPAVVGVVDATTRIRNGQRVRVDGSRGWVTVIPPGNYQATPP